MNVDYILFQGSFIASLFRRKKDPEPEPQPEPVIKRQPTIVPVHDIKPAPEIVPVPDTVVPEDRVVSSLNDNDTDVIPTQSVSNMFKLFESKKLDMEQDTTQRPRSFNQVLIDLWKHYNPISIRYIPCLFISFKCSFCNSILMNITSVVVCC